MPHCHPRCHHRPHCHRRHPHHHPVATTLSKRAASCQSYAAYRYVADERGVCNRSKGWFHVCLLALQMSCSQADTLLLPHLILSRPLTGPAQLGQWVLYWRCPILSVTPWILFNVFCRVTLPKLQNTISAVVGSWSWEQDPSVKIGRSRKPEEEEMWEWRNSFRLTRRKEGQISELHLILIVIIFILVFTSLPSVPANGLRYEIVSDYLSAKETRGYQLSRSSIHWCLTCV